MSNNQNKSCNSVTYITINCGGCAPDTSNSEGTGNTEVDTTETPTCNGDSVNSTTNSKKK